MKTKMKKKCVKILTMIICMASLVVALVILPSADIAESDYKNYQRISAVFDPSLLPLSYDSSLSLPDGVTNIDVEFNQTIQGWIHLSFSDESRESQDYYFNKIKITSYLFYRSNSTRVYYTMTIRLDDVATIVLRVENQDNARSNWQLSYVTGSYSSNYYMQNGNTFDISLYYIPSSLTLLQTSSTANSIVDYSQFSALCTSNFTKVSQSLYSDGYQDGLGNASGGYDQGYSAGYSDGVDFGLEEGYNNGYDQGSIDGYQQGYSEGESEGYIKGVDFGLEEGYGNGYDQGSIDGYRNGYNEGYETGYTDGSEDGYSLGYDEGEVYGWQNGFGAGQNDMAETSHTFKEMVFAIFDAPSRLIDSMLNFDVFGINLAGLVKTIITLAVVAVILVILLKWLL